LLAKLDPKQAGPILARVWREGTLRERQNVLRILGELATKDSDSLIIKALDQLATGRLAPEVELDLREAAEKRSADPAVARALARVAPKSDDLVAAYLSCLQGGDADRGARVFRTNTAVECLRCHKIQTKGGEVGPELTGIGSKRDRKYLLEAIVAPNRAIAEGFESVVVARVDGTILTGVFRGEDETHLRLVTSEGKLIVVPKSEIEERRRGPSAMPEDLYKKLSKSEIRDVVEFLSSQR
jgi:quinoprotein glucose dehydrogenase